MSYNKVQLIGRVGNDPEIKNINSDVKVASFSLATSEKYTNKAGEKVENTEWHKIVVWRKTAEIVERYVKKGDQLFLEGKISYRSYDDKEGNKKYITEIVCDNMIMLGGKKSEGKENTSTPTASEPNPTPNHNTPRDVSDGIDDLPF